MIQIIEPNQITWQAYKNLRLEALKLEPQAYSTKYEDELITPDEHWQQRLVNYCLGESSWMVFAKSKDKHIGMVGAFQSEEDKKDYSATVIAMYVAKEYRGQGISKNLLTQLFQILKTKNIHKTKLAVNQNQTTAFNLYQKIGFVITLEKEGELGDGNIYKEYEMEKVL